MKRTLSLVLALVMVLGSFSTVFAADLSVEEKAGAFLKEAGVLAGNAEGNLMLEEGLKRQDAVILLSKLMGEFEVAKEFPTSEESPSYKDIRDKFYLPFLAWAEANKTFVGKAPQQFGFGDNLTTQEYARVLLVVLGYGEVEWKDTLDKAEELGLLADIDVDAEFLRGNMAVMTFNALGAKAKDSTKTLAEELNIDMPAPPAPVALEVESVEAINLAEIKVVFNTTVDEDSIDLKNITVDGVALSSNANNDFSLSADGKTLLIYAYNGFTTQQQTRKVSISGIKSVGGSQMKAIVDEDITFIDTTVPQLESIEVVGNRKLVLTFSEAIDPNHASTKVYSNYRVNGIPVVGVGSKLPEIEWRTITLEAASPFAVGENELTFITGAVRDYASYNAISKGVKFTVVEDTTKPTVEATAVVQERVTLKFSKEIILSNNVEVYWMNGSVKRSATLLKLHDDKAIVTASFGTANALPLTPVDIVVKNATDYFGNKMDDTTIRVTATADITRPEVLSVTPEVDNEEGALIIKFSEGINLATVGTFGNVVIKNRLGNVITNAQFAHVNDASGNPIRSLVRVTRTSGNFAAASGPYTITIKNVEDRSVQANKSLEQTFTVGTPDVTRPTITQVGYIANEIKVVFSKAMDPATVRNVNNYKYSYALGAAPSAAVNDAFASLPGGTTINLSLDGRVATIILPTNWTLSGQNTTFTHFTGNARNLMISNLRDLTGNEIFSTVQTISTTALSETAATATTVEARDKNTLRVNLNGNILPSFVYAGDFVVKSTGGTVLTVTNATLNTTYRYITLTIAEDLTTLGQYEVSTGVFESVTVETAGTIQLTKTALGNPIVAFGPLTASDVVSPKLALATTGVNAGVLPVVGNTVIIPFSEPMAAFAANAPQAQSFVVRNAAGTVLTNGVNYTITADGTSNLTLTMLTSNSGVLTIELPNNTFVRDANSNLASNFAQVSTGGNVIVTSANNFSGLGNLAGGVDAVVAVQASGTLATDVTISALAGGAYEETAGNGINVLLQASSAATPGAVYNSAIKLLTITLDSDNTMDIAAINAALVANHAANFVAAGVGTVVGNESVSLVGGVDAVAAVAATKTITVNTVPFSGTVLAIGNKTVVFNSTGTAGTHDFAINTTTNNTAALVASALRGITTGGNVVVNGGTGNQVVLEATTPGTAGNALTVTVQ